MSTAGRTDDGGTAPRIAARLAEAPFVRLLSGADGDAIAATGLLARTLGETPFHVSVPAPDETVADDADGLAVAVGRPATDGDCAVESSTTPASETAFAIVGELDGRPDPALALAGALAADAVGGTIAEAADTLDRRPGIAVPTTDPAEGLAHSTLVHAPFSADSEAARELLSDAADERVLASLVALATVGADGATDRAATAVERFLRPYVGGPFETVGGLADVLDSVAREAPGTAVALALGHDVRSEALAAWRRHASRAHEGLRGATTGRYDGLFVVRDDGTELPVGTVAKLAADYRSPEPVTLALTDGRAAAVTTDGRDPTDPMRTVASALDGTAVPTARGARASFDGDSAEFALRFREAL